MTPFAILLLYIAFRVKQFVCDFLLQNDWMALNKGRPGIEGYKALLSHCLIHAAGTLVVITVFAPALWWLPIVDFIMHALFDRFKGMLTFQKEWKYTDRWFWWSFGLDQEAHNLTHLAYILIILAQSGIRFI
jgi:hypothetical protein